MDTGKSESAITTIDWSQWKRVLVVVAHPDDPEYGLSAAVSQWTAAGVEVTYLLLTHGEAGISTKNPEDVGPMRAEEQRRACDVVGVDNLTLLHHPDSMLTYSLELRRDIARVIRQAKPDVVITAAFDVEAYGGLNQADHRVAGLATIDATRDAANPWAQRDLLDAEGLEPWSTTQLLVASPETPNALVAVDADAVDLGVRSLEAHSEYLAALPDHPKPADFIPEVLRSGAALVEDPDIQYAVTFRAFDV